jgi:DNA-binding LacI/PurR family transcriptional regulator
MARRAGRPSQQDIARLAGVSQAVVSVVLSGKAATKSITPATQARIRAVAAELGYVPDVAARSLRGGRNGLIGVHTFERVFPVQAEDYYHEFLVGIEEQAVAVGQDLVLFASTQRPDGTRSIYNGGASRLRLADGAIILGLERNDDELERLAAEGFPFVFIGRRDIPGTPVPYVAVDYPAAVRGAIDELLSWGHTAVAYLGGPVAGDPQAQRRTAYAECLRATGLAPTAPMLAAPDQITAEWLTDLRDSGVTAVLVETYELADALAAAAKRQGCEIPADLSVAVLDSVPNGSAAAGWSRTAVPRREMGARAVAVLQSFLDGAVPATHVEILPCDPLTPGSIARPSSR